EWRRNHFYGPRGPLVCLHVEAVHARVVRDAGVATAAGLDDVGQVVGVDILAASDRVLVHDEVVAAVALLVVPAERPAHGVVPVATNGEARRLRIAAAGEVEQRSLGRRRRRHGLDRGLGDDLRRPWYGHVLGIAWHRHGLRDRGSG